ncbi:hypothetical protein FRC12_016656, partial [Ceratobasidium sp. 428]
MFSWLKRLFHKGKRFVKSRVGCHKNTFGQPNEHWSRLTKKYPHAITDFHGAGTPCIFKTGPKWPVDSGFGSHKITRAARPIHEHPIQPIWVKTAFAVADVLDSLQVRWSTIDPLAYGNAGQARLICEFVIIIAVQPVSLAYDAAVAAAAVKKILEDAGFPDIEVAFVESIYCNSGTGLELMGCNPSLDLQDLPALRKPFTSTL